MSKKFVVLKSKWIYSSTGDCDDDYQISELLNNKVYNGKDEAESDINKYREETKESMVMTIPCDEFVKVNDFVNYVSSISPESDDRTIMGHYNKLMGTDYKVSDYEKNVDAYYANKSKSTESFDIIEVDESSSSISEIKFREFIDDKSIYPNLDVFVCALNEMKGVHVINRSLDNGKVSIEFECSDDYSLSVIARAIAFKYAKTVDEYVIKVLSPDNIGENEMGVIYEINNEVINHTTDEEVHGDINLLVGNLRYWNGIQFKDYFNGKK